MLANLSCLLGLCITELGKLDARLVEPVWYKEDEMNIMQIQLNQYHLLITVLTQQFLVS